jgi:L-lysine 6-transaminase
MSVIDRLRKHILADGFHIVADIEKSQDSWIVDAETGKRYLDCYSQFASQPLGWNYKHFQEKDTSRLQRLASVKLANSDMYSETFADFVETFASILPDFKHFFFIDGGALAVENALKAAFDWKCQIDPESAKFDGDLLNVIHLKEAFHGRSGYTLSLTNTDDNKTRWFPKFHWTRVKNPKIEGELATGEHEALYLIETAMKESNAAAFIAETIQGEGGDNHFRPEFFKSVRELCDRYGVMFILDEVQCGMGITGKWWAYEHMNVKPDLICFGKKSQVCGFASTSRIEEAKDHVFKKSGRINSTWGGNLVDMERSRLNIEVIKEKRLVDQAAIVGEIFLKQLRSLPFECLSNFRGRGLMIAFDLPNEPKRDYTLRKLQENGLLALKSGQNSIRFRPALTFSLEDVFDSITIIEKTLKLTLN